MIPLENTAGVPGLWTASYQQLRTERKLGPDLVVAVELVHSIAGHAIRAAGGTDSNYGALEARLSW